MDIFLRWPDNVPLTEMSKQFMQGMLDRMAMGYINYGALAQAYPDKRDALSSMRKRMHKYSETKNTEWLMDAANFLMIEFMLPAMDGAHFTPTDNDQSPGRVNRETGSFDKRGNNE